jgi:tetratricopeptide (TPR) repeat protein
LTPRPLGSLKILLALALFACAKPLPPGAIQTVVDRSHEGRRLIFVGLDGADFRLLDRFVADGTMPKLGAILARSERRILLTQHPPLSPLVWTSMMTGVSPVEHRVLDFTRFHPVTRQQEPITSDERAVPAIWNIAQYGGKRAGVFGLWATFPAEAGVVLTDRDLPRDYVAATDLVHARAARWIADEKPDLAIVYIQGTDEIGHFTAGDVEKARGYFRRIDAMLDDYRALAERLDAELVIASDHGFDWGGAHEESSTATATAAKWHRNEGVWIHWPRAAKSAEPAHVDQVCATLIEILGLPRGEGIAAAIGDVRAGEIVNYRRYFRAMTAEGGRRHTEAGHTEAGNEQVANLKALGYIGSTEPAPASATGTRTPQSFNNEGLILREQTHVDEAERAFRAALAIDPAYPSARKNLDDLLSSRGVARLRARDCAGALADFRGVAHESALLWAGVAAAEGCLGNEAEAKKAMDRATALDPKLADAVGVGSRQ